MKKVLVTSRSFGKTSDVPFEIFEKAGVSYTLMGTDFSDEKFKEEVVNYDALIIGAHPFDVTDMEKCKNLKIIAKHGAGLDNIHVEDATRLGITVTNVPSVNSDAVADLAFGHILNISRGISFVNEQVHKGEWKTFVGRDVYKKTLGITGFGAIGKNVARRAKGFSMQVLVYDPFVKEVPEEFKGFVTLVDMDRLTVESDIISIHMPLIDSTKNLFDKTRIMNMKKDAYLVNTSRGGIINEKDLYDCMSAGHLSGCALTLQNPNQSRKIVRCFHYKTSL